LAIFYFLYDVRFPSYFLTTQPHGGSPFQNPLSLDFDRSGTRLEKTSPSADGLKQFFQWNPHTTAFPFLSWEAHFFETTILANV
jgi:hypothetical protein